jgi:hypothetical protein
MNQEQKDNSGVAFVNQKKQTEMQPDYTGNVMIDGKLKDVSIWNKKAKSGIMYFTLAFRDKKIINNENQ